MTNPKITEQVAKTVLSTIDAGLVAGVGEPVPGQMCVEAAVCFALGLPHGDDPKCVSEPLRQLKITLNDANWSSPAARASGLRRLGIAQLGTIGVLDEKEFSNRVALMTINTTLAEMLDQIGFPEQATACREAKDLKAAQKAARDAGHASYLAVAHAAVAHAAVAHAAVHATYHAAHAAVHAAHSAVHAATAAVHAATAINKEDQVFSTWAERVVQILIDMKAPGCQFLYLTE